MEFHQLKGLCASMLFNLIDAVCLCIAWLILELTLLVVLIKGRNHVDCKKQIIIFANEPLGDTIIKLPFFIAMRKLFVNDNYHIVAVLSPQTAPVFTALGCFDEVISEDLPPCKHVIFWTIGRGILVAKALRWAFRNKAEVFMACDRYRDLGCDFAHRLCKPYLSIAYDSSKIASIFPLSAIYQKQCCDRLYTHLLSPSCSNQIDDTFAFLSFAVGRTIRPSIPTRNELSSILDMSIAEDLNSRFGEYIVLTPGAGASYRKWPTKRFAALTERIGGKFVIVGAKAESSLAAEIAAESGQTIIDLCGRTNIMQLLGVLSQAQMVITNETGTATCSAMLGARTVCILGGGDFGSFFPNVYFKNVVSVFHKESCFACGWKCTKEDIQTSTVAPCINSITVEDVFRAVNESNGNDSTKM